MDGTRMRIRLLEDGVYLLDDAGESTCYVVLGTEKAMVIDTVNGHENLLEIVRTLTPLPLVVVNTHGHCDHIWGNGFFEEAWIHPADAALAQAHAAMGSGVPPLCRMRWLEVGQRFDLGGGNELEVVGLEGHTPGSIGLLDRGRRLLFSGDGVIPHVWMQLEHSLTIAQLRDMLTRLLRDEGDAFDRVLTGHATDYLNKSIVEAMLAGCEEMLRGDIGEDRPYRWFDGESKEHVVRAYPSVSVVYAEDKL